MESQREYGVELGRWIRHVRTARGMTAEQVWNRMEMSRGDFNWISQIENGRRRGLPDVDYLIGLSQAFNVTMTDVLRGAGVLPIDVEEATEQAPGSATIHALVDMIDWTREPYRREAAESLLRTFLEQDQRVSRPESAPAESGRGQR